jgi:hypothetical protein
VREPPRRTRALLAALWLALSSAPARAYVRATDGQGRALVWHGLELKLVVADPAGPLAAELREATRSAARRWAAATGLQIEVADVSDARPRVSEDGINRILLRSRRWCPDDSTLPCHDPTRSALTQLYTRPRTGSPNAGEIIEADIEINAVHFDWRSLPAHSLDTVLLHELGHVLGLDHTCRASTLSARTDQRGAALPVCRDLAPGARQGVMYPDPLEPGLQRLELSADELEAAAQLYGGGASRPGWLVAAGTGLTLLLASLLTVGRYVGRRRSLPRG